MNHINTILSTAIPDYAETIGNKMWNTIETEIQIHDCDIYSFNPDPDSDPFEEEGKFTYIIILDLLTDLI